MQNTTIKGRRELYPLVTVDVALFCVEHDTLQVLLVRRANVPEQGQWALPGGLLQPERDANVEAAALRVLREKIDVDIPHLAQVAVFSGKGRDERGWSLSVLHYALLPRDRIPAVEKHKVEQLAWKPAHDPGHALAFDHRAQLDAALNLLRARIAERKLPLHLLPGEFTLSELQRTCEAIMRHPYDKSVFRRQIKGHLDLVVTDKMTAGGRQRPAVLHRARDGFAW